MSPPRKPPPRGMTAAEFMAFRDEARRTDPSYSAEERAVDAERGERVRALREAEQPIVKDLRSVGVEVTSVWDLVNTSAPYPSALPVLLDHLKRGGYPDRVMESLGRAMAVRPAAFAWDELRDLYGSAEGPGEMSGLAAALAASATSDHLDELVELLHEKSRGDSRIHMLRAIKRVGGPQGLETLRSLATDSVFGPEARALLSAPPT